MVINTSITNHSVWAALLGIQSPRFSSRQPYIFFLTRQQDSRKDLFVFFKQRSVIIMATTSWQGSCIKLICLNTFTESAVSGYNMVGHNWTCMFKRWTNFLHATTTFAVAGHTIRNKCLRQCPFWVGVKMLSPFITNHRAMSKETKTISHPKNIKYSADSIQGFKRNWCSCTSVLVCH